MPSSIFSSDGDLVLPSRRASRPLAAAVVVAIALLIAIEVGWRALGFVPAARDTLALWALHRDEIRDDRDVVVVIGSSRAQLGIDPVELTRELGRRTVQLGESGTSPLPVLRDLADDPAFSGLVICEVTPASFFLPVESIDALPGAEWARGWRHLPWISNLETQLRLQVQQRLALLGTDTNIVSQLSALVAERRLRPPPPVRMRADRFRAASYGDGDATTARVHWTAGIRATKTVIDARQLEALVATLDRWIAQIRARGGDVVFVRSPSSSTVFEAEQEVWPRAQFWDVFARTVDARAIYFADEPTLRGFVAAEGSHLDAPEARAFSRELARVIARPPSRQL